MHKSLPLVLFIVMSVASSQSQSPDSPYSSSPSQGLSQGNSQNSSQGSNVDCTDPTMAASPLCNSSQGQRYNGSQSSIYSTMPTRSPVLTSPYGFSPDQYTPNRPLNPSQVWRPTRPTRPETEFEQIVADTVGRPLPLFGQSLFVQAPSTFAPIDWMQVPSDYIVGPGDELQIKIWGQVEANLRVTVDRSGQVYIPQVGEISVAGVHYSELEQNLKRDVGKIFKNFNLTASIGRLRSIQVMVVGDARYPGTYTISSLSTLVNAIFTSGGPTPQGSLRHIQVRRDGNVITDFDLYDLLIQGDKSKDVRLQSGDVLYIPHVGPLVAMAGSVNSPGIYEVRADSTLKDLVQIAGDLSPVADTGKITVDRFVDHSARKTLEFPYDAESRALALKDGDIVRVLSIVPRFEDTVTLRGNVANPGRYPWKPGMRVSDLIPDAQALLTRRYWRNRAAIVNGSATEYPIPTSPPQSNRQDGNPQSYPNGGERNGASPNSGNNTANPPNSNQLENSTFGLAAGAGTGSAGLAAEALYAQQNDQSSPATDSSRPADTAANPEAPSMRAANNPNPNIVKNVAEDVRGYAPEINWDYAIIQRVNPVDLSSKLLWMSPRKVIIEHDPASNLELQPGDIVTIFSQRDISVPQVDRSQYVIIEGEVMRPGVYKLEVNETLHSVLQRSGGLTPDAYVFGSELTRESARADQQKSLEQLANSLEVQIRQSAVSVATSGSSGDLPQILAAQQAIITQLRNTRASGRVALPVKPKDNRLTDFPDMILEDSDRLTIPHIPSTVSVVGDVYNPGSFIYEPRNSVGAYLEIAGKGKPQSDLHHSFVLRANGFVVAANNVNGVFTGGKFDRLRLYPGDQIIVPYKLPTGALIRGLRDWTQISSQLALTGAAVSILR